MSTIDYAETDLRAYLLGSLSSADTERFDELSLTSDEFVEALEAAEADLVDSYSNNDLSPEARALFERRFLGSSSGRSKIAFSETFRTFIEQYSQERYATEKTVPTPQPIYTFAFFKRYMRWGLAAGAAAAVVIGGWFFFQSVRSGEELVNESRRPAEVQNPNDNSSFSASVPVNAPGLQPSGLGNSENDVRNSEQTGNVRSAPLQNSKKPEFELPATSRVFAFSLMPQMRSGSQTPRISIPVNTQRASVRLELEPTDFNSYQIVLTDPSNREIWKAKSARPSTPGGRRILLADIPARLLRPGIYRISVSGLTEKDPPENVGDYSFKVER